MKLQSRSRSRSSKVNRELREKVDNLLKQESRFIYAPEFETIGDDRTPIVQAEELLQQLQSIAVNGDPDAEVPSGMDLDEVVSLRNWSAPDPLLTFEDEQILFRAMNLLRFRINQKRAKLSSKDPSARLIAEIDSMLGLVNRIRSQLVNSNLRLVSSIARKFASTGCDVDDFSSDGCMILLGAIDRFDYSRGFRFSTYATHSIQRHFFRAWKMRQRRKERFPNAASEMLNEVPQHDAEEPICSDPEAIVADLIGRADALLDNREQQILLNRYGLGDGEKARTLREIAADLGISKERVRQLQMKALNKLRDLLDPEGKMSESMMAAC